MPDVADGQFWLDLFFHLGPFRGDLPLCEADLEPWERRREIELLPWQAELIVDLSKQYMREMTRAKDPAALCPWPKGVKMWMYVTSKKHEQSKKKESPKEPENNGSRKRHRNPATR